MCEQCRYNLCPRYAISQQLGAVKCYEKFPALNKYSINSRVLNGKLYTFRVLCVIMILKMAVKLGFVPPKRKSAQWGVVSHRSVAVDDRVGHSANGQ